MTMRCRKIAGVDRAHPAIPKPESMGILCEQPESALTIFEALGQFPADFMTEGRQDSPAQERGSR